MGLSLAHAGGPVSLLEVGQLLLDDEAAKALHEQGIRPTVAGVRISLGGGSPNDLAPALKQWRDVELPKPSPVGTTAPANLPVQIVDLAQEIWRRALAAAVLET